MSTLQEAKTVTQTLRRDPIGVSTDMIIEALSKDFVGAGRQDLPEFLANQGLSTKGEKIASIKLPVKRQGRNLKAVAE